jgi:hypothetical protein
VIGENRSSGSHRAGRSSPIGERSVIDAQNQVVGDAGRLLETTRGTSIAGAAASGPHAMRA